VKRRLVGSIELLTGHPPTTYTTCCFVDANTEKIEELVASKEGWPGFHPMGKPISDSGKTWHRIVPEQFKDAISVNFHTFSEQQVGGGTHLAS